MLIAQLLSCVLVAGVPELPEEREVRLDYAAQPRFATQWPVEYHIKVLEPLTQRMERALVEGTSEFGTIFTSSVVFGWGQQDAAADGPLGIRSSVWQPGTATSTAVSETATKLSEYLGAFDFVDRARVKIVDGRVASAERFEATLKWRVAGRERAGDWRSDAGKVSAAFVRTAEGWRIGAFALSGMTTQRSPQRFFKDVSQDWLTKVTPQTRGRLLERSASEHIETQMRAGRGARASRASSSAADAHPGAAVVDLDGDGWDDLVVWDVLGDAALLRNDEGRGFVEFDDDLGLNATRMSAAAFADLDNDGDLDAVIGHWFSPSKIYYRNAQGRFEEANVELPSEVVSIAVADVDRDARLDIYFATAMLGYDFVTRNRTDAMVDASGPLNRLFLNGAAGLVDATASMNLALQRNTLQASFADFDADGWIDLFLANDFAPSVLYRNQGGKLVDITREDGAERVMFGMGASWGDVDGDTNLDLYVSAMWSSAGQRVTTVNERWSKTITGRRRTDRLASANGSRLISFAGGRPSDLTATPPFAPAAAADWSYGSQLTDIDNDGWLDIYAPSGFYTGRRQAPGETVRDL